MERITRRCAECGRVVFEGERITYGDRGDDEVGESRHGSGRCDGCDRELCRECGDFEGGVCRRCREQEEGADET